MKTFEDRMSALPKYNQGFGKFGPLERADVDGKLCKVEDVASVFQPLHEERNWLEDEVQAYSNDQVNRAVAAGIAARLYERDRKVWLGLTLFSWTITIAFVFFGEWR